jgi:hypothetical protein
MSTLNKLMSRGIVPPQVHGVLDYPLAAILIAGPLVLDFDDTAATVIASSSAVVRSCSLSERPGRPGS